MARLADSDLALTTLYHVPNYLPPHANYFNYDTVEHNIMLVQALFEKLNFGAALQLALHKCKD